MTVLIDNYDLMFLIVIGGVEAKCIKTSVRVQIDYSGIGGLHLKGGNIVAVRHLQVPAIRPFS